MSPRSWIRNRAPMIGGLIFMALTLGHAADFTRENAPRFVAHTTKWFHLDVTRLAKTPDSWSFDYVMESKLGEDKTEHLIGLGGPDGLVKGDDVELTVKLKTGTVTLHLHRLEHTISSGVNHLVGDGDWEIAVSGQGPAFEKIKKRLTEIWTATNQNYDIKVDPLKFPALLTQPEAKK